jgi:hypothetical protein
MDGVFMHVVNTSSPGSLARGGRGDLLRAGEAFALLDDRIERRVRVDISGAMLTKAVRRHCSRGLSGGGLRLAASARKPG